jgi:hypothetical protein
VATSWQSSHSNTPAPPDPPSSLKPTQGLRTSTDFLHSKHRLAAIKRACLACSSSQRACSSSRRDFLVVSIESRSLSVKLESAERVQLESAATMASSDGSDFKSCCSKSLVVSSRGRFAVGAIDSSNRKAVFGVAERESCVYRKVHGPWFQFEFTTIAFFVVQAKPGEGYQEVILTVD